MLTKILICCSAVICLIILNCEKAEPLEQNPVNIEWQSAVRGNLHEIIKLIDTRNYAALKQYASKDTNIRWTQCGPTDREPFVYSPDYVINMLTRDAMSTRIYIDGDPEIIDLEGSNQTYTVVIRTEGWSGEYPFLNISFVYSKSGNQLRWVGACFDAEPPVNERKHMVREYYRQPILPRPGPRVFNDPHALGARISEITRFTDFDALSSYAVKKRVVFSECGQNVIVNEKLEGEKVVPVDQVINYLKKNMPGKDELKITGREDIYTAGWRGEYPYISFIISKTKKGWEWTQVRYCRTSTREMH